MGKEEGWAELTTLSCKTQIVMKTLTKGTLLNLGVGGPPMESMTPLDYDNSNPTQDLNVLFLAGSMYRLRDVVYISNPAKETPFPAGAFTISQRQLY